ILENKTGMAPGMIVHFLNKVWIFLPGVPTEMKQMIQDDVIPYLRNLYGQDVIIKSKILRFIGIGEAKLEDELKHLIRNQTNTTIAIFAHNDGIIVRFTFIADTGKHST